LDDVPSLENALRGVDLVVSTLSGPTVGKQINLIHAAKAAGVKRFIPSEFGTDIKSLKEAGHTVAFFEPKLAVRAELQKVGLEYVLIENGFFYTFLLSPFFGVDLVRNTSWSS
jgi:uncharacterized protein YbjT (DUF2867 family)